MRKVGCFPPPVATDPRVLNSAPDTPCWYTRDFFSSDACHGFQGPEFCTPCWFELIMHASVGGFQGCSRDKQHYNWRCARAVRKRPLNDIAPPCMWSCALRPPWHNPLDAPSPPLAARHSTAQHSTAQAVYAPPPPPPLYPPYRKSALKIEQNEVLYTHTGPNLIFFVGCSVRHVAINTNEAMHRVQKEVQSACCLVWYLYAPCTAHMSQCLFTRAMVMNGSDTIQNTIQKKTNNTTQHNTTQQNTTQQNTT